MGTETPATPHAGIPRAQMPDDGALFRYWCEEASYRPVRVAKALANCATPDDYRTALLNLMLTDTR